MEKMPYRECPSFEVCSSQKCPLDPYMETRIQTLEDEKCKAHKPTRFRIGSKYPELLKFQGLTPNEWHGKQRALTMTQADKDKQRDVFLQRMKNYKKTQKNDTVEGI